jgi:AcrR family transcriptional regulator
MSKRRGLNRELVIAKAVELANSAGTVDAVTLAQLAQALDVRTPSLYNHVDGLEDLRHGMAAYGLRQLLAELKTAVAGKIGRDALFAIAFTYHHYAKENPAIYPLTIRAPDPGEDPLIALAQELLQLLLLVLASAGVQGNDAIHAIRGYRAVMHGFIMLEAADGYKMAMDREESYLRVVTIYLDGLGVR